MELERFEKLVDEGIKSIPEKFLEKLENVDIVVEEGSVNSSILGLYQGVPKTERWHYAQALPDKITIFKKPIERMAKSEEEVKEIVRDTVWHEIAHHFGMDEKAVRKAEHQKRRFR